MAKKSRAKAAKKGATGARAAKKTAKRARKKPAKTTRRAKPTRTTSAKAARKSSRKKAASKPVTPARRTGRTAKSASKSRRPIQARKTAQTRTPAVPARKPNLDRERRTIRGEEDMVPSPPSSLNMDRTASAVRSGRREYEERLREHTSTGPAMTGGDVDADWEDAETVGDEAPGGDNPTPDQDVVDEIGRAIGIEYDDDQELQGGDELVERDRHRWELDPASKEDIEEE